MSNAPGTSLVVSGQYLDFPDMSFFEDKSRESQLRYERLMQTDELFADTMGAISIMGIQAKPDTHFILKAKSLYDEYFQENDLEADSRLYEKIEDFLLRELLIHKAILPKLGEKNRAGKLRSIEKEGSLRQEIDKLNELINFFEDLLDDIKNRNNIVFPERKTSYKERKKQILEGGRKENTETSVVAPQIPYIPASQVGILPQKGALAQATNWLISLGSTWEKLEESYRNFATEFQERCLQFLKDETNFHGSHDHAERRIREIFDEVYERYNFPKGFKFSLSEVHFGKKQTHVDQQVYDEETKTYSYERVELEDVYGPNLRVTLKFDGLKDLPEWINASYSVYGGDISEKIYLDEDIRKLGANTNLPGKVFFLTQFFQVGKYRRDISKKYSDILEDDVLTYLLEKIGGTRGDVGDLRTLEGNIKRIEQVWENKEELKGLVRYIGFEDIQGYMPGSYEGMVKYLNREAKKVLPIPNRYVDQPSNSLKPQAGDRVETMYRNQQFMDDLSYYFTSQKSNIFRFQTSPLSNHYVFTFFPKEKSDENSYDVVHVDIWKDRIRIKVKKGLDTLEDDEVLEEVYGIVGEAIQYIEKSPKTGRKK